MGEVVTTTPAALVPLADVERMAAAVAKSGLFGTKSPEQAMALMLVAQAEGLHPATAARDYHVIQGRASMKSDAMLARFLASGGRVEWHAYTDAKCDATFSHPAGGSVRVDWTTERAKAAGLAGKDNWRGYARAMLRARVISEAVRTVNPGCITPGVYSEFEVRDMPPAPAGGGDPPEVPRELVAEARKYADRGTDAFRAWWKALAKDQRNMLSDELADLQQRASDADVRTVDVDASATTDQPREPGSDDQ